MAEMIDSEGTPELKSSSSSPEAQLVDWVVGRVRTWRNDRDSRYSVRWEEYYRLWRGIWLAEDKNRNSERSRLITPALQQAIESVTSEIESAILDKPQLFDMVDDDENGVDVQSIRQSLQSDMEAADYEQAMNEIFLMGSIYGTGLGKLDVIDVDQPTIVATPLGPEVAIDTRSQVRLVPILPSEFVIDSSAKSIADALGCAHEYTTPRHKVLEMQGKGVYRTGKIAPSSTPYDPILSDEDPATLCNSSVNMIDYQGFVPRQLLTALQPVPDGAEFMQLFDDEAEGTVASVDEDDLVEALITIGNEGTLLKAVESPSLIGERAFVAYRHEIVPNQFWGRGVGEKGYNSQKALDASIRARIDGLALTVHPMMGIDAGKMPKGFKFTVAPGKTILTNGDPATILRPMNFGNIDPNQFTNNAELERYVTVSTGGADTGAPVTVNGRNETASGMSMQLGNFVKRAKRTIRNIEREFIIPMVQKTHRMYMLLEPSLYPPVDVTYTVTSVLGTMARELEQQQFSTMLNTVEQGSPAFWMLMKSIYQTSSLSNRESMLPMIEEKLQQSMQPPPPDPLVELKRAEVMGRIKAEQARIQVEYIRAQAEIARAANDARTAASEEARNESQAILNIAKAEAAELGTQLNQYRAHVESLEKTSVAATGLTEQVVANVLRQLSSGPTAGAEQAQ